MICLFLGMLLMVAGTVVATSHGLEVTLNGGTALLTVPGITVTEPEQTLLAIGPMNLGVREVDWTLSLSPLLGAGLLAAGVTVIVLVAWPGRRPRYRHAHKALAAPR